MRQGEVAMGVAGVRVEPLGRTLGAVVTGVDLRDVADPDWRDIVALSHHYAVLVFPAQHLAPDEQRTFATRFGPLSTPMAVGSTLPRSGHDHGAFDVANLS